MQQTLENILRAKTSKSSERIGSEFGNSCIFFASSMTAESSRKARETHSPGVAAAAFRLLKSENHGMKTILLSSPQKIPL